MADPNVRELLFARVDQLTASMDSQLAEVREVTEQLEPERVRSCRNAITMVSVMVDEIRLRAHARPLDDPNSEAYVPAVVRVATVSGRSSGCSPLPGDRFASVPQRRRSREAWLQTRRMARRRFG